MENSGGANDPSVSLRSTAPFTQGSLLCRKPAITQGAVLFVYLQDYERSRLPPGGSRGRSVIWYVLQHNRCLRYIKNRCRLACLHLFFCRHCSASWKPSKRLSSVVPGISRPSMQARNWVRDIFSCSRRKAETWSSLSPCSVRISVHLA